MTTIVAAAEVLVNGIKPSYNASNILLGIAGSRSLFSPNPTPTLGVTRLMAFN